MLKKVKNHKKRCADTLHRSSILHSSYSGVQSNFAYSGRVSSQGRVETDEKEGQIFASSHCICHGEVMVDLSSQTALISLSSYRMNDLMKFFNARRNAYHTDPKLIDEVIYTPYVYEPAPNPHASRQSPIYSAPTGDLLGIPELREHGDGENNRVATKKSSKFDTTASEAEIFMFEYGTIVIWGMTEPQEKRFLSSM